MSTLANYTVTSGAAVKIVDSGSGNVFAKVSALGTPVYLGPDNTVTVATGVPLDPRGETWQFTADSEVWAIAQGTTASVRVLSWV